MILDEKKNRRNPSSFTGWDTIAKNFVNSKSK